MTASKRIAIFVKNAADVYSGGRYLSMVIAEALAQSGHTVYYVTNQRPMFYSDFETLPAHGRVILTISPDFSMGLPNVKSDLVLLIPGMDRDPDFFLKGLYYARLWRSRVGLMSFEDPLWFNALAPEPRPVELWNHWVMVSQHANLILNMSALGSANARKFYRNTPSFTVFGDAHPAINSMVCDAVPDPPREKRIMVISRFSKDIHKGGGRLPELMDEKMRGHTLVMLVGTGSVDPELKQQIESKAKKLGIRIDYKYKLTDKEKFHEIKRCCLMIFPSLFEGYGYPPVEAQYCNVPCVCFDLPVLREHSGIGLYYVPHGDWAAFKLEVARVLTEGKDHSHLKAHIAPVAKLEYYGEKLSGILLQTLKTPLVLNRVIEPIQENKSALRRIKNSLLRVLGRNAG